ncbi:hypothetical protein V5R04_15520 [Jonesiaceae bacterium BS-20]|uniref:Uncharacterized protein n=1 Tax=Jonesiaceae bacterium BS-20 TaxID=3120821 RepID=A0AAU7DW88_9MICO
MQFKVPRGEFRTALARLLPHAGGTIASQKNEDPWGRIRFSLDAHDRLVMWTGDNQTRAVATAPVTEYLTPEIDHFDIDAAEIQVILSALKPVGSAEQKSNWLDQDFLITVDAKSVRVAEHWSLHPATKEVTVPRVLYVEDPYPDFPSAILSALTAPQALIESSSCRQALISRVAISKYDELKIIGIDRQALLIGGDIAFAAVIPAFVDVGPRKPLAQEIDLTALVDLLERHVRPPRLPTDEDSLTLKQRTGWENGFEQGILPIDRTKPISSLKVITNENV